MKEQINPFSDDVYSIIQKAGLQSKKYYQTFCGTGHLFLALISFLSQNKETEKYGKVYKKIREILNEFSITGPIFEENFLLVCPRGEAPKIGEKFTIKTDIEFNKVSDTLRRRSVEEQRTMEIEDFISELFYDRSFVLFSIMSAITGSDQKTEEMYNKVIQSFKNVRIAKASDLDKVKELTNLNSFVLSNPITTIGGDKVIRQIELALAGRITPNALLVGPAGTGKTTFVLELAQRINKGNVSENLKNKVIYQLDPNALIAGTRFRGDFEEKLNNIIMLFKKEKDAILFIDEAHNIISLGGDTEGANSAGNVFKPFLSRGELQMILATTDSEYSKFMEKEKAFIRRFNKILVEEPTIEETAQILKGIIPVQHKFFNKTIQEELVDKIANLSSKYTLDQANPAKSIQMLDVAFAFSKVFKSENKEVVIDDIIEATRLKYNIYISDEKFADTKKSLFENLLGQDKALEQVCKTLETVDKGLIDPERPLASFLLAGPTGVGKTETAKIIAKNYFGSDSNNLIKINCSELSQAFDVTKLTGAAPGYVGYDEQTSLLSKIKQYPNSLVLFDEIEKAHPTIFKTLLNLLDSGEMTDNKGNRVSFRNCIVVFTTNLGYNIDSGKGSGLGFFKIKGSESDIDIAIKRFFTPEFLGRLDDIVIYSGLGRDIAEKLIERNREFFCKVAEIDVSFSKKDIDEIIENSKIEESGVRGLKKAVKMQISEIIRKKENAKTSLKGKSNK